MLAAVTTLARSTVEVAAASVGDGGSVKAVQEVEEDSKASDSLQEVAGTEIQEELEEVMVKEAAEGGTAAANQEEMKPAEEEEQEAPPPAEDAEDQVTGADPHMDSSEVPAVDPAPEEATREEAATDEEAVGAEKATQAEEPTPAEEAARTEEATKDEDATEEEETMVNEEAAPAEESILNEEAESQRSDLEDVPAADPEGSSAAPPTRLHHSFGEMAPPAAQREQLFTGGVGSRINLYSGNYRLQPPRQVLLS